MKLTSFSCKFCLILVKAPFIAGLEPAQVLAHPLPVGMKVAVGAFIVEGGGYEPPLKSFLLHSRGNSPPYNKAHLPQTQCGTVLRVVAQSAQVLVAGCALKT
jgi:hypothetical protein